MCCILLRRSARTASLHGFSRAVCRSDPAQLSIQCRRTRKGHDINTAPGKERQLEHSPASLRFPARYVVKGTVYDCSIGSKFTEGFLRSATGAPVTPLVPRRHQPTIQSGVHRHVQSSRIDPDIFLVFPKDQSGTGLAAQAFAHHLSQIQLLSTRCAKHNSFSISPSRRRVRPCVFVTRWSLRPAAAYPSPGMKCRRTPGT